MPPSTATSQPPSIAAMLASRSVVSHFQPILSARQKSIVGFEALSRGVSEGRECIAPIPLFEMAEREGCAHQLQQLCHHRAVHSFQPLASREPDSLLFLNLSLTYTDDAEEVALTLLEQVTVAGLSASNVAIEILEAEVIDRQYLRAVVDELRRHQFLIVLDDVGAGHSNLDRVSSIRPDILKIDRGLVANVDVDFHRQRTLKSLIDLSRKIGALVITEGIETEAEALMCLELGADLLQGFFLAIPAAADRLDLESTIARIDCVAQHFKLYMTRKINDRKFEHRRFNVIVNEMLCDLSACEAGRFHELLAMTILRYPTVECLYVLDQTGRQVTSTICSPNMRRRQGSVIFRPAPRGADHSLKEYYYILLDVELHKYTTDPYVSLASGNVIRTLSTYFRDAASNQMYVLCVDIAGA